MRATIIQNLLTKIKVAVVGNGYYADAKGSIHRRVAKPTRTERKARVAALKAQHSS